MLKADGFDRAIIGLGKRCGQEDILAYSVNKIIDILVEEHELTEEEALDYYSYNIVGSWLGEKTPIFIEDINDLEELLNDKDE